MGSFPVAMSIAAFCKFAEGRSSAKATKPSDLKMRSHQDANLHLEGPKKGLKITRFRD
jgi:hypothetical protein